MLLSRRREKLNRSAQYIGRFERDLARVAAELEDHRDTRASGLPTGSGHTDPTGAMVARSDEAIEAIDELLDVLVEKASELEKWRIRLLGADVAAPSTWPPEELCQAHKLIGLQEVIGTKRSPAYNVKANGSTWRVCRWVADFVRDTSGPGVEGRLPTTEEMKSREQGRKVRRKVTV